MTYLSLFSGGMGGDLACQHLLGWKCLGYVEIDKYCQKLIKQRIADGYMDAAPIYGDIRKFIGEGYAESYTGMVDCITAGFPCQPHSVAGKQLQDKDPRDLWPETGNVISIIKPGRFLFENVPGIRQYLPVVYRDLRRLGYRVQRPGRLGADDVGANHRRKRIWIKGLGYASGGGLSGSDGGRAGAKPENRRADVADTERQPVRAGLCKNKPTGFGRRRFGNSSCEVAEANSERREEQQRSQPGNQGAGRSEPECSSGRRTESRLGGMANGVASGLYNP